MFRLRNAARVRMLAGATVAAALATAAFPALASACTVTTTGGSPLFKQFGDLASYTLMPGGTFENGTAGWSLSKSSVVSGNEPYYLNSRTDSHSLSISPGGSAVSPPICVSSALPSFRFFGHQTSGGWAQMNVNLLWTDAAGWQHTTTAGSLTGSLSWFATPLLALGNSLPLWQANSTISVRLQFLPAAYGGAWSIDDVYIDPYSK